MIDKSSGSPVPVETKSPFTSEVGYKRENGYAVIETEGEVLRLAPNVLGLADGRIVVFEPDETFKNDPQFEEIDGKQQIKFRLGRKEEPYFKILTEPAAFLEETRETDLMGLTNGTRDFRGDKTPDELIAALGQESKLTFPQNEKVLPVMVVSPKVRTEAATGKRTMAEMLAETSKCVAEIQRQLYPYKLRYEKKYDSQGQPVDNKAVLDFEGDYRVVKIEDQEFVVFGDRRFAFKSKGANVTATVGSEFQRQNKVTIPVSEQGLEIINLPGESWSRHESYSAQHAALEFDDRLILHTAEGNTVFQIDEFLYIQVPAGKVDYSRTGGYTKKDEQGNDVEVPEVVTISNWRDLRSSGAVKFISLHEALPDTVKTIQDYLSDQKALSEIRNQFKEETKARIVADFITGINLEAGARELFEEIDKLPTAAMTGERFTNSRPAEVSAFIADSLTSLNEQMRLALSDKTIKEFFGSAAEARKIILDEWAKQAKVITRELVVQLAESEGVTDIRFGAWAGPQGTGKGTNQKAIRKAIPLLQEEFKDDKEIPESLKKLMGAFSGKASEILSGTGGMFNMPAGEYAKLFAGMNALVGDIVKQGLLVSDDFTMAFTQLMIAKRIVEGSSSIQIDLVPRSAGQKEGMDELVQALTGKGIKAGVEILDLRLMPEHAVKRIAEERAGFAVIAKQVAKSMKKALNEASKVEKSFNIQEQFDKEMKVVVDIIGDLQNEYFDNQGMVLVNEILETVARMKTRFQREPRQDELPFSMLTRLRSYYESTMPGLINIGAPLISTFGSPSEVVMRVIKTLIPVEDHNHPAVKRFIKIAGERAEESVNGHKSKEAAAVLELQPEP